MAHPIARISSLMNNFYTLTVYRGRGGDRIIHTLLGEENFQKGMQLYLTS
ncbi:hypothetical protein ACNKHR_01795 [Shigella flexneri]